MIETVFVGKIKVTATLVDKIKGESRLFPAAISDLCEKYIGTHYTSDQPNNDLEL
jgi:hypothetical protein